MAFSHGSPLNPNAINVFKTAGIRSRRSDHNFRDVGSFLLLLLKTSLPQFDSGTQYSPYITVYSQGRVGGKQSSTSPLPLHSCSSQSAFRPECITMIPYPPILCKGKNDGKQNRRGNSSRQLLVVDPRVHLLNDVVFFLYFYYSPGWIF